ncbi:MAG: nucleoid-associated protein [Cyclobacteriaceae bacterium]|nr:nucleoid-associated protein [Cyclobacteriaceae bacterium]
MTNLHFTEIELLHLITHRIGNKSRDEQVGLSVAESVIDEETTDMLLNRFLGPVNKEEVYSFMHPVNLEMNEVYVVAKELFADPGAFITSSHNLATLLYEQSLHPKIMEGKLNVVYFSNVMVGEEMVDAIGLFKSEQDVPFIKMLQGPSGFNIKHEYGFELKGLDKGCLILNTEDEDGYRLLLTDNKSADARYWMDEFLKVQVVSNEFQQTRQFLNITKDYITKELTKEFEVTKTDQIDLLNRSVEYFKSKEKFDKEEFEDEVLQDGKMIQSFHNYNEAYAQDNDYEIIEHFEISPVAVKKQARIFKSVIKLDKNFHIYIHGNKDLIEQGVDEQGRKYYKIYYDKEK